MARRRLTLLSDVSEALASSLDYRRTLEQVARLFVPEIADSCTLLYFDGGKLERVLAHADPDLEKRILRFWETHPHDPQASIGLDRIVQSGQSELRSDLSEADLESWTLDPELLSFMRQMGLVSAVVAPLRFREEKVGALCLLSGKSGRHFSEEDRALAQLVARWCTITVENARLHEAQRQAIGRLSRLQRVTAALGAALSEADVADMIVSEAVETLGAEVGVVSVLNEEGTYYRNLRFSGYPESFVQKWPGFPAEGPYPVADAVRAGEPVLLRSRAERRERYPQLEFFPETYVGGALAAVPMRLRGRPIGGIGFLFPTDRDFPPEDREFLLALAHECAQALERARLLRRSQDAVRLRDDFLSVAGHELRSPANAAGLIAESLLRRARAHEPHETLAEGLEKLIESMDRLTRLTRDLLDATHIAEGRLQLKKTNVDLADLAARVARRFEAVIREAGCSLVMRIEPATGEWDGERLDQVITNLLSNACKFGAGRPVEVSVETRGELALLSVRDHGIGISPEDQTRLFRRFERVESRLHFGGMGLGLWISRRIVEAHGGTISVESSPGAGATFKVELPRR